MNYPVGMQKMQDWLTQRWVIFRGKKIDSEQEKWLIGPFGNIGGIGEDFIYQLAKKEDLFVDRSISEKGLIPNFSVLNIKQEEMNNLQSDITEFYEKTSHFKLFLAVKWNPFFRITGILLSKLFGERLQQLNIPTKNQRTASAITSEIITLNNVNNTTKYTFWLRTDKNTNQVIYSGIYTTTQLPDGRTCVKAIFPLPNGNATVIMYPKVTKEGALILESSGKKFGDAGFYFLLKDAKGQHWAKYVKSFRDTLVIQKGSSNLEAKQIMTLWDVKVVSFEYKIIS